jgi:hypothetical protein
MRVNRGILARGAAVLLASALVGAGAAGVAYAVNANNMVGNANYDLACDEGGPGWGRVCRTDNAAVYYYMDSNGEFELEEVDRDKVRYVMANYYRPTDLSVTYDSSPVFSGDAETDVIYQEGAVSNGFDGYTWCNDDSPSPKYECDQTYIRIRGAGVYTNGLTCHETGHSVGLLHGANSNPTTSNGDDDLGCMQTPVGSTTPLGANQRNRINNTY